MGAAADITTTVPVPASDRPVALITACGTATAYGLVRTLRERWGEAIRLVGTDAGDLRLVAGRELLDECHAVPLLSDPGFDAALDTILAAEAPVVYRPLIDNEIARAARRAAGGLLPDGVVVPWPGVTAAEACADKLALAGLLTTAGIAVAPTRPAATVPWDPRGVVTKPRGGFGSIGVRIFESEAALERERPHLPAGHIGQPLLAGPEVTVDAWRSAAGTTRAVARERLGVRGGVATKCRVYEDDGLAALATRIGDALDLRGSFCFQVLHDADGAPLLTDLNARPGGATRMTVLAGADLLCAPFAELWGLPFEGAGEPLAEPRIVVRHFEETLV